jgi:hypothetical protein
MTERTTADIIYSLFMQHAQPAQKPYAFIASVLQTASPRFPTSATAARGYL